MEVNDSYNVVSHTKRVDLIGKSIFKAFPDNHNDQESNIEVNLLTSFSSVLDTKLPDEMAIQKYDIRNPETGELEERYWLPKNIPILDENGNVAYIMHSVVDVTAGITLEQKVKVTSALLEKNQQHYYSLFQQNPDAVFSIDLEGTFLSANNAFTELAECSLEEVYKMSFIPFVAPEDLDRTLSYFNDAAHGKPQRYEVGMITAKGTKRIVNVTNLPIIVNNKVVGVYGIAKDVTEFVATQQELLKSKKRFEMVSKVSNDAIWEWNLITNEVTRAGNGFYNLFGYSLSDSPLTDYWISLIHPDDVDRILYKFKTAIKNPEVQMVEEPYRVLKADGTYAYIVDKGIIVRNETGKAIQIYGNTKDISIRKQIEAERELLIKELTQSNLDLKQFSYIASHNLRAPISNLVGLGNMIDEKKIEDPMTRMMLEKYKQTATKLNENVNELLEILVLKNNQDIQIKEVQIDLILKEVTDSIENYLNQNAAELKTDFFSGNSVKFNPGYLHSILLNLLTNAIKYRSPERELQIKVYTTKTNNILSLHFEDNGLGMDLEKYGDKVFGLYQKFHSHPESKGVGLHIVATQVKAMGAQITVNSQLNIGTTFTIQFNK